MTTPLRPAHYFELFAPLDTHDPNIFKAQVISIENETTESRTLVLKPGRRWKIHHPGQHVSLSVLIDGRYHSRTYSISSSPDRNDDCITITIKAIGLVSHYLFHHLQLGNNVLLGIPRGNFLLPEILPKQLLFITAGSGITPIMSMLRTLVLRDNLPDILHIHYAPHMDDVIFGRELRELAIQYSNYELREVYTREQGSGTSSNNHFNAAQLCELCPDWRSRDVWICGPPRLLNGSWMYFEQEGRVLYVQMERFFVSLAMQDDKNNSIYFLESGKQVNINTSTSLLCVAENAGLNPKSDCRIGICGSCNVTLLEGCVRDLRNGGLTDISGTTIQLCINAAVGAVKLAL